MAPDKFILAVLKSLPDHTVKGAKRLQKLAMLLQYADLDLEANFSIRDYGPFSSEVAQAADELYWTGALDVDDMPLGVYKTFQSVYKLPARASDGMELPNRHKDILLRLDVYSTVELEVASTIAFFEKEGFSRDKAIEETIALKPTKAIRPVLLKAEKILAIVS